MVSHRYVTAPGQHCPKTVLRHTPIWDEQDTVHCDRYLEEWTHAGKLAVISKRTKMMRADGLEGRRYKMR
jgi:hypothetical protein